VHRGRPGRIGRHAWAQATFAVHAEAQLHQQWAGWCAATADLVRDLERAQQLAADATHALAVSDRLDDQRRMPSPRRPELVDRIAEQEREIDRLEAALSRYGGVGGTPRLRDIGTAGERLLAAAFTTVVGDLTAQVGEMARHPSVAEWAPLLHQHGGALPPDDVEAGVAAGVAVTRTDRETGGAWR
jgi:hypothetical protein